MDSALLAARGILALVFAVAGIAKLADLDGSRKAVRGFGLPAQVAAPLGTLLPLAEILIAAALLPADTAWLGALAALVLLLAFVVGISVNLAQGRQPDCHCFGQLYSAPVSWQTLARNGLLALIAAFVVWQGRANPGVSILSAPESFIFAGIAAAQAWYMLRLNHRLLRRVEALEAALSGHDVSHHKKSAAGLPIGTPAPDFQLPDLDGTPVSLQSLRANGLPLVLLFTDPTCDSCVELMPDVAFWQEEYADDLTLVIISRGAPEVNRAKRDEHGLRSVLLQQGREISRLYDCNGTPGAVLIRADGTIGSLLAMGAEDVADLVEDTLAELVPN
jgi:peroxiredoxin/uncharacterized membrane protein YphA (DoxX/SURF4 family)